MILDCLHTLGILFSEEHMFSIECNHLCALGPSCLSCSLSGCYASDQLKWYDTLWGYPTGTDGEVAKQWAVSSNLSLIHDAKLPKSFTSARWKIGYNLDLIFVSTSIGNMCGKSILDPIPHTQHRPIFVTVNQLMYHNPLHLEDAST